MPVRQFEGYYLGRNEQGQFELVTIPEWLTESGEPIFNLSISRAAGASSQTPMLESMLNSQSVVSTSTSAEPRGQVNTSEQVGHIVFFLRWCRNFYFTFVGLVFLFIFCS